jgi:hypothetical protein
LVILDMLERRVAGAAIVLLGQELGAEEREQFGVRGAAERADRCGWVGVWASVAPFDVVNISMS